MSKIMAYLYFAYGSNLLASRMLLNNPDATRVGIARLDDHRLDFEFPSRRWGGHASTIVPSSGDHVWGALWQICDLDSLDNQEGVSESIYKVRHLNVTKPDNSTVEARMYQLVHLPKEIRTKMPSRAYLETIIQGAKESNLPESYISELKKIKHDGYEGPIGIKGFNITFRETA